MGPEGCPECGSVEATKLLAVKTNTVVRQCAGCGHRWHQDRDYRVRIVEELTGADRGRGARGAFPSYEKPDRVMRPQTHAVRRGDGMTLCGNVEEERLGATEVQGPPTCVTCARRAARLAKQQKREGEETCTSTK